MALPFVQQGEVRGLRRDGEHRASARPHVGRVLDLQAGGRLASAPIVFDVLHNVAV